MKVSVLSENLSRAMSVVIRGISSRSQLPTLSNVLIRVTKTGLEFVSTDLEISFVFKVGAKIEEEGEILVPAKLFNDLVTTLAPGTIELMTEKQTLQIKADGTQAEVTGMAADEYPSIPRAQGKGYILTTEEFKNKVGRVTIAAAKDNSRPILEGILWILDGKKITIATTDGYRMGTDLLTEIEGEKTETEGVSLVLPVRAVQELIKVLPEGQKKMEMEFDKDKQQVIFRAGELEMISRLIGGEFPPFMQIIPKEYKTRVVIERGDLMTAVRRASIFSRGNANIVMLEVSSEGVEVSANSAEVGKNTSKVQAEVEGDDLKTAFNGRYLLEYLGNIDNEQIILESGGDLKPGVFKIEGEDFLHVIMPIRQNT